jgi:hypothetical protein
MKFAVIYQVLLTSCEAFDPAQAVVRAPAATIGGQVTHPSRAVSVQARTPELDCGAPRARVGQVFGAGGPRFRSRQRWNSDMAQDIQ